MTEINFSDYLSGEEKKEIVVGEFRSLVQRNMTKENDLKRILSNVAYDVYYSIVDECFDGKSKDLLKENIDKIIANPTSYNIFNKPDAWDVKPNYAYEYLQECINNNKGNIAKKVAKLIDGQVVTACKGDIAEMVENVLAEHIRGF